MTMVKSFTIDEEHGQIILPIEIGEKLNLQNFDWLKVHIKTNQVVLCVSNNELDEELLKVLIHEGVLIDIK